MKLPIETDEEFVALMRARFASKPYSGMWVGTNIKTPEYWTDDRYEELIQELLARQRKIRAAAENSALRQDDQTVEVWDDALLQWAIWSIQTHDVGATPTHWHRVWSAVQSVISATRYDERRRIAAALRADHATMVGATAAGLIASDIASQVDGGG